MKLLLSKKILSSYIVVCIVVLISRITGYSFTFRPINIVLITILIVYPITRFIAAKISIWIKLFVGLTIIVVAILVANDVAIIIAFGSESRQKIKEWHLRDYKVVLTKRQGWAGPPYLQYDLIQYQLFRVLNKEVAVGYPDLMEDNSCVIKFKKDYYNDSTIFKFDTCKSKLTKVQ